MKILVTGTYGGCGATSLGLCLSRILSRSGRRVAFVSYAAFEGPSDIVLYKLFYKKQDPKSLMVQDPYGVWTFPRGGYNGLIGNTTVKTDLRLDMVDVIVYDVPAASEQLALASNLCDVRIAVDSRDGEATEVLNSHLGQPFVRFSPDYDPDSFLGSSVDIHGAYGSEVRTLADRLGLLDS